MEVRHLRCPFPPPPLILWLILCVVVPHTHRDHPPKLLPNVKHHIELGFLPILHVLAAGCLLACLLAACLLRGCLGAKPVRSTLDTKAGYKTKNGSPCSVTLTRTEYWDGADGGRNMVWDTSTKDEVQIG